MNMQNVKELMDIVLYLLDSEGYVSGNLVLKEYVKRNKKQIPDYEINAFLKTLWYLKIIEGKQFGKIVYYYKRGENYDKFKQYIG